MRLLSPHSQVTPSSKIGHTFPSLPNGRPSSPVESQHAFAYLAAYDELDHQDSKALNCQSTSNATQITSISPPTRLEYCAFDYLLGVDTDGASMCTEQTLLSPRPPHTATVTDTHLLYSIPLTPQLIDHVEQEVFHFDTDKAIRASWKMKQTQLCSTPAPSPSPSPSPSQNHTRHLKEMKRHTAVPTLSMQTLLKMGTPNIAYHKHKNYTSHEQYHTQSNTPPATYVSHSKKQIVQPPLQHASSFSSTSISSSSSSSSNSISPSPSSSSICTSVSFSSTSSSYVKMSEGKQFDEMKHVPPPLPPEVIEKKEQPSHPSLSVVSHPQHSRSHMIHPLHFSEQLPARTLEHIKMQHKQTLSKASSPMDTPPRTILPKLLNNFVNGQTTTLGKSTSTAALATSSSSSSLSTSTFSAAASSSSTLITKDKIFSSDSSADNSLPSTPNSASTTSITPNTQKKKKLRPLPAQSSHSELFAYSITHIDSPISIGNKIHIPPIILPQLSTTNSTGRSLDSSSSSSVPSPVVHTHQHTVQAVAPTLATSCIPSSTIDHVERCNFCSTSGTCPSLTTTLPCFHKFCKCCIEAWLKKHKDCPVCGYDVAEHNLALDSLLTDESEETIVKSS